MNGRTVNRSGTHRTVLLTFNRAIETANIITPIRRTAHKYRQTVGYKLGSSVSIVKSIQAGRPENLCFIPKRVAHFYFRLAARTPMPLTEPLSDEYGRIFLGEKAAWLSVSIHIHRVKVKKD